MAATTLATVGSFFAANAGTIAAVSGSAATVASVAQSNRAKAASRASQRAQALQQQRARRQAIRQSQIQRARAQSTAAAAGAQSSSGALGGIGSISSQLGSGLGYNTQQQGIANQIGNYNQQAANWGTFGGIAGSAFQLAGGFNNFVAQPAAAGANVQTPDYFSVK